MPKGHPEFSTEKGFLVPDDKHRGLSFGLMSAATYDEASDYRDETQDRIQQGTGILMGMILPGGSYRFGSGTATAPSIAFAADTDTGRYWIGSGNVGETVDGTLRFDWNTTRILSTLLLWLPSGTAAAPALSFSADTSQNLGLYRVGEDNLGLTANGSLQWDYNTTRLYSNGQAIYLGVDGAIIANTFLSIDKTLNASLRITMRNNSNGGNATTGIYLVNDNLNKGVELGVTGTGFTPFGEFAADEAFITCDTGIPLLIITPSGEGIRFATGGTVRWTLSASGYLTWTGAAASSGSPTMLTMTGPAHTGLAADTEASDVTFNLGRTVEFTAGGGAFTNQRAFKILAPTYAATAAETITNAATLYIDAQPAAGTNMTLTSSYALWVDSGKTQLDGELEIDGALNHDGTTVGLYAATPTTQGTGGQNVTNNVTDSGSTAGTIPDITDGTTYANDYTNLRRALYQLARMLKQDHDQLRAMGILT